MHDEFVPSVNHSDIQCDDGPDDASLASSTKVYGSSTLSLLLASRVSIETVIVDSDFESSDKYDNVISLSFYYAT